MLNDKPMLAEPGNTHSPKIGLQNAEAILLWNATITGVVFQDYEKFRRLCYLNIEILNIASRTYYALFCLCISSKECRLQFTHFIPCINILMPFAYHRNDHCEDALKQRIFLYSTNNKKCKYDIMKLLNNVKANSFL
ncbi:hypothetical protein T05_1172, partial [Trichinella murrelli]